MESNPPEAASAAPPTTASEDSVRHALTVWHELLAGYRSLVYKLLIAHTGFVLAIAYFVATISASDDAAQIPSAVPPWFLNTAACAEGGLFLWWMILLKIKSDRHVARAVALWSRLHINWDRPWDPPGIPEVRPELDLGCFLGRVWAPPILLPVVTTAALVVWINGFA